MHGIIANLANGASSPSKEENSPHNYALERVVLGGMLFSPAMIEFVHDLDHLDFFNSFNAELFEAIKKHVLEYGGVTPHALFPLFRDPEAKPYIAGLVRDVLTYAQTKATIPALREYAARRFLHDLTVSIDRDLQKPDISVLALGDSVIEQVHRAFRKRGNGKDTSRSLGDAIAVLLGDLDSPETNPPIETGFKNLDSMIGGLRRGELIILAGRPSMGKSAFAVSVILNLAAGGNPCHMFSLEMRTRTLTARALSDLCYDKHPMVYNNLLDKRLYDGDRDALKVALRNFKHLPLIIDDQRGLTVSEIATRARQAAKDLEKDGQRLACIVVDHLGIVTASDRYAGNKVHETAEKTNALRTLAGELDCAVLCLAQLNRGVEGRENKRPTLPDLRDAGNIEEDADTVIFAYREAYYKRLQETDEMLEAARQDDLRRLKNCFEAIVAKNRNGPAETANLWCDIGSNAFRNADPKNEMPAIG